MRAFDQLGEAAISLHKIVSVSFGMGRGEADALKPVDFVHSFEKLDKRRLAIGDRNFTPAVAGDDLAEQRDLFDSFFDEAATFGDDVRNGAASFLTAGVGNNAEGAVLIAALHDADEGSDRLAGGAIEQVL